MNFVFHNSECGSGCESGWTSYLEHSSISPDYVNSERGVFSQAKRVQQIDAEDEEEEDLSMVSDASSGPPHFHEEDDFGYNAANSSPGYAPINATFSKRNGNRQKAKENRRLKSQEQACLLDDTASSPFFDFSNKNVALSRSQTSVENVLEYSHGYSTTQFEGRYAFQQQQQQQHYGFFQSSLPGNQLQQNQWFEGKRW